jgi:hypothetical protein
MKVFGHFEPGDIICSQPDHVVNRGLARATGEPLTHVSLYLGDEAMTESHPGRGMFFERQATCLEDRLFSVVRPDRPEHVRKQAVENAYKHMGSEQFSYAALALGAVNNQIGSSFTTTDGISCADLIVYCYNEVDAVQQVAPWEFVDHGDVVYSNVPRDYRSRFDVMSFE